MSAVRSIARTALKQLVKSRRFQFLGGAVARAGTQRPLVCLTFDDGPDPATVDEILDLLRDSSVRATFFVVGESAEAAPGTLERILAGGHVLGNHSYTHHHLVRLPLSRIRDEVERTDAVIRRAGQRGPIDFRPPYCAKFLALPYFLARTGRRTVLWDVEPDSLPADAARRSPDEITRRTLDGVRPGSIILLHPMGEANANTRAALPEIIADVRRRGYDFTTVAGLLAAEGRRRSWFRRARSTVLQARLPIGSAGRPATAATTTGATRGGGEKGAA